MYFLRHLLSVLLLPFTATVVVPALLVVRDGGVRPGFGLFFPPVLLFLVIGILLVVAGLTLIVKTNVLFYRIGQGTLAPWDPTRKLVVQGVYRYVRNPMIAGVMAVLLGEGLCLGSTAVLGWWLVFVTVNVIYMPMVEEPGLVRRFGEEYRNYCRNVPRWIPRLRPWEG
jgi:protein-S-isoprenylcysteine O-methyltransferase Ste14